MMAYIQEMQHISRRAHIWKKTASMQEDGIYARRRHLCKKTASMQEDGIYQKGGGKNPSPGGEGRVRGLFLGIVEKPNSKAKQTLGKA